jgi:predicted TIM-barrel fold metal-dependent hydrolase
MTKILDIHHHMGPRDRLTGTRTDYDFEAAAGRHIRVLDEYGFDQAALIPSHNSLITGPADIRWLNEQIASAVAAHPDRFAAAIGTVDPGFGDLGLPEIEYAVTELGMKALAWHSRFSGIPTDAPAIVKYVRLCAELDVPVLIHAMAESTFESMWRLVRIAQLVPNARILALDAFTTLNQIEYITQIAAGTPNLQFETAVLRSSSTFLQRIVDEHGPEKIVFGSDYYDDARTRAPGAIAEIGAMELTDEQRDMILGGNARRFLGID